MPLANKFTVTWSQYGYPIPPAFMERNNIKQTVNQTTNTRFAHRFWFLSPFLRVGENYNFPWGASRKYNPNEQKDPVKQGVGRLLSSPEAYPAPQSHQLCRTEPCWAKLKSGAKFN